MPHLGLRHVDPVDLVGIVKERGDEHERHCHGKEDLYAVRFVRRSDTFDQFEVDLPSFGVEKTKITLINVSELILI